MIFLIDNENRFLILLHKWDYPSYYIKGLADSILFYNKNYLLIFGELIMKMNK